MPSRPLAPLAAALLVAACGGKIEKPRSCRTQADCPADSFCREAVCVASAPPIAAVSAPAAPHRSHTRLTFAGSRSRDPDPEDHVASLSWTARRVQADCDPFPGSAAADGVDAPFAVVFGCAGTFEVRLVATDATGRASEPAVVPLTVVLSDVVPAIAMGSDLTLQHLCTQGPLLCTTGDSPSARTFALSAAATSPVSGVFQYQWTVELPAALAATPPRVVFTPSATAAAPTVRIETDGTAIAGDYLFSVAATDEWHLTVVGRQRVSVGNRPPVVAGGGAVQVAHRYDAATAPPTFRAGGVVAPISVVDPDGDPLTDGITASMAGADGTTFDVSPSNGAIAFAIAVPHRTPADALLLLGAPGLSRTITYGARDPNGGQGSATWDVAVMNRAPRLVLNDVTAVSVDHAFDAARSRYLASALLSEYVDDDGDPIAPSAPTGDPRCAEVSSLVGGGRPQATCSMLYTGTPAAHLFAGSHRLQIAMGDPWASTAAVPVDLTILNRPPRLTVASLGLDAPTCTGTTTCCLFDPDLRRCVEFEREAGPSSLTVPPPVVDPDGDPLAIAFGSAATPPSMTCAQASCPNVTFAQGSAAFCPGELVASPTVTVSDGAAPVTGVIGLGVNCP